jgi:hypothetical protein
VLRRWVHCSGLTYGHTVMVHERDRGFLRTLARLVVALTLTGIVMVAVVTWLPEWAQGWIAAPIGLALIFFWALRDTPFDLSGRGKR